ncbi:MAG: fructose-6-phosphate aldolase [Deltaproteobacteria bacterium]|nr:MAG: fructose-6-phosphate aldolase [Deltaproteobacteria bacterium]
MKFFLDTANLDEIRRGIQMGLVDGVTTNPTLISKEGREFWELVSEICRMVDGPVSLEVTALEAEGMIKEARELAKIGENVVVKIPMTEEGIKAVKRLEAEGVKTNVTLVFSPLQALIAAKAGASYVSPFIGRLDDISTEGMRLVEDILTIFSNYDIFTQVIVASVRHPMHVLEAALLGADIVTMPFRVMEQLFRHPLTDIGLERFLKDWEKVPKRGLG